MRGFARLRGLVTRVRWVHLHPASATLGVATLPRHVDYIMRVHETEVPSHPVLRACRPYANGNGAREVDRRDGVSRLVRDRRAVLVHEVPAQHEGSIYPVLGLEVQSQQGSREVLIADVTSRAEVFPFPHLRMALSPACVCGFASPVPDFLTAA